MVCTRDCYPHPLRGAPKDSAMPQFGQCVSFDLSPSFFCRHRSRCISPNNKQSCSFFNIHSWLSLHKRSYEKNSAFSVAFSQRRIHLRVDAGGRCCLCIDANIINRKQTLHVVFIVYWCFARVSTFTASNFRKNSHVIKHRLPMVGFVSTWLCANG